jgi:Carboxypeptidase regulatory-like domain/PEGA domain
VNPANTSQQAIDELRRLHAMVEQTPSLPGLKPIFYRVDQIVSEHPNDAAVAALAAEVKQHLSARGAALRVATAPPAELVQPQPAQPVASGGGGWVKAVVLGAGVGVLLLAAAAGAVLFLRSRAAHKPPPPAPVHTTIPVHITTTPAGAAIRIGGEVRCQGDCTLDLDPGTYTITATLPGYDPLVETIRVSAGAPSVRLALVARLASLRCLADLASASAAVDDAKPQPLDNGELTLDSLAAGAHQFALIGSGRAKADFGFTVTPGSAPAISSPVSASHVDLVVVAGLGDRLHIEASPAISKVSLDGKDLGEPGANGIDVNAVAAGDHSLSFEQSGDTRTITVAAADTPLLTVWAHGGSSGGTLLVSAGQDDATVYVNGKEYRRKTRHGRLWIPNLAPGSYTVRVSRPGFIDEPEQHVTVVKGQEAHLTFNLRPMPSASGLHIAGAPAGTGVLLDGREIGRVQADGTFSMGNIPAGEHTIVLSHDQYTTKRIAKNFQAGETVELSGGDVALEKAHGTLKLALKPANAQATIRATGQPSATPLTAKTLDLPAGAYELSAKAPGYEPATRNVEITAGHTTAVELTLAKVKPAAPAALGMSDWENPAAWSAGEGWMTHRGAGLVLFRPSPLDGTLLFTVNVLKGGGVFHHKRVEWVLDYVDARNYILCRLEKNEFNTTVYTDGKAKNRPKVLIALPQDLEATVQIDISPAEIVHRLFLNGSWKAIDTIEPEGATLGDGKFGFLISGTDELGLSNFSFHPK